MSDPKETDDPRLIMEELARFPVLEGIDLRYLEKMAELSKVRRYDAGDLIIKEGKKDNWIYFLISGKVSVQKNGQEIAVLARQGDLFGEMRIMDGFQRWASVTAVDDTTCLAVNVAHVNELAQDDKIAFGCVMYKVFALLLAHRLRVSDSELVELKKENSYLKKQLGLKE